MPTITLTASNVSLTSSWTYAQSTTNESGWTYTTPSTVYDSRTFSFSSIPTGATINSAQFSSTTWGSGTANLLRVNYNSTYFTSSNSIPSSYITPGGSLNFTFMYRATGGTPGTSYQGTKSSSAGWSNITLTVSYTEPVTAPRAPTSVSISPSSALPEASVTLSWSGASAGTNNGVVGYTVYKSTISSSQGFSPYLTVNSTSTSSNITFSAPTEGTSYYKVMTRGASSTSSISSAYATLSIDLSTTSEFVLDATSVDAGTPITLTISNATDLAHIAIFSFGGYNQTIEMAENTVSTTFTPPLDWLNAIPNNESGTMQVVLKTSGGGTKTKTVTLRCPDDVVPIIGDVSISRVDGTVPSDWGIYVAGFSRVRAVIETEAEGVYSSPISRYQIYCNGNLIEFTDVPNGFTTNYLVAGEQEIIFSAIDGRGRIGSKKISVEALPYTAPFLTNILSLRSNAEGEEDNEGLYAVCRATLNYADLSGKNSAICSVSYRIQGSEEWTSAGALNGDLLLGGDLSLVDNFEIRYEIIDAVGGTGISYDIVTRAVREINIMRGGGAWAFGGIANEKGVLKVYGNLKVIDNIFFEGKIEGQIGFYSSVLLSADYWTSSVPYKKTIVVPGLPEIKGRPPSIQPTFSTDPEMAELEEEVWANIYHAEVNGEEITFYSYEQPTQTLQLHISVI